jgi:predicted acyl esterase
MLLRRLVPFFAVLALVGTALPAAGQGAEPTIEDDIIIESFDGEPILATLMLPSGASAQTPVPAVLRTHGWGGERERTPAGIVARLLDEGYAVLTWDSRGFGDSGGEANIGSPNFEVKDAQALIDYLDSRPEILEDESGIALGWTGGSNAAGVQFNTAAVEDRIDAIVPEISWGNLVQDLNPNGVYKQGWGELLYNAGLAGASQDGLDSPAGPQTGDYAPEIHQAYQEQKRDGTISKDTRRFFAHKSTVRRSGKIEAPTLIIQGSVDTLFPLEDAFRNYRNLVNAGTEVKLMTYCAGHTLGCSYPGGASGYPDGAGDKAPIFEDRIVAWLDRHVKGEDVDTGPEVEWQAQDGFYYSAPRFPLPGTRMETLRRFKTGIIAGPGSTGGDGPTDGNPAPQEELGKTAIRKSVFTPGAVRPMLGIPKVKLRGEVTGTRAFVFLELVDVAKDGTRVTIDDQTMPIILEPGTVKRTVKLHGVSWILKPGHKLQLEITTGSGQYQAPQGAYTVELKATTKVPLARKALVVSARRAR